MKSVGSRLEPGKEKTGKGVEQLAEDVETFIAYSSETRTQEEVEEHIRQDDRYFEQDVGYVGDALDYLQERNRIKPDIKLGDRQVKEAFSISDYST